MKTSAEILLKRMERLYENIYNLLSAFQAASTNNGQNIKVQLKDDNGKYTEHTVNSFMQIQQELNRIDANYRQLVAKSSYSIDSSGQITTYNKVSYLNADFLENFTFNGNECIVDKNSFVEDFVYPTIKLPININKDITNNSIYCRVYDIIKGWDAIPDNPKEINLQYLKNNVGSVDYKDYSREIQLEHHKVNYFGKFSINRVEADEKNQNVFVLELDTVNYTSKEVLGNNHVLKIGDQLVSNTGSTKYQITDIDTFTRTINVLRIGGIEKPVVGVDQLLFNQILPTENKIVNIPIKPSKKLVIFLSVENPNAIGYPSVGIKIDTTDFKVIHNDVTYTIDEYFQKYVTNFSEYLNTLIDEATIPYSLGVRPNKPVLNAANFKVVQINKHLLDAATQNSIIDLNKKKQQLQNEIDAKQTVIDQTQKELDSQKFNSAEEKTYRLQKMISLRNEINTLKSNLLSVARDIDSNATKFGLKNVKPKYKVIGFWDLQENLYSPVTPPQHIIKYEVLYRYLRKDIDVSDTTTYKMISNGKEITVAFSNWNELNTKTLNKVTDENGNLHWETVALDSINDININQCSISINEGESIEIKIRAVTEAGYPISPMVSDWSEPIRIDFPDSLKNNNLQATVNQNDIDLNRAEFNALLQQLGVISHLSDTIKESEKTFFHHARDIASGQYTEEQKNISVEEIIKSILQDIKILKATDTSENIVVSFVDFNNEEYTIKNNTTLSVFAGNYTDGFDLTDITHYGDIIRKRGYLKIRNNNMIPVELNSLIPGNTVINTQTYPKYYGIPVLFENSNIPLQTSKQIIYLRNIDVIGSKISSTSETDRDVYGLLENPGELDSILLPDSAIDNNGTEVLVFDGNTFSIRKIKQSLVTYPFVVFDKKLLDYVQESNPDGNATTILNNYFSSICKNGGYRKFSQTLKKNIKQQLMTENNTLSDIHFSDYDKYSIGRNTVGAFLYPYLPDVNQLKVDGDSTISSLIIPQESEILIPIIYEYRMTDALGKRYDSENNVDTVNDITYTKKIGFDMLINNSVFKFDLQVSSKLQSRISSTDMTSVRTLYRGEGKEQLR